MSITRKQKNFKPTRFMEKAYHYDKEATDYAVMFIENLGERFNIREIAFDR